MLQNAFSLKMAQVSLLHSISATLSKLAFFLTLSLVLSISLSHSSEDGTLGPECLQNPPTLSSSYGAGSVVKIGGLKAYVSGHSHSKLAILLVSDIFGYEAPHLRMIADKVATSGFYVVVPDFFYGDPYVQNSSRTIPDWLKSHGTDKGFKDAKPVIAALKKKGIGAIGAAGFCWGGKVTVKLATTRSIRAAVLLHPSWVTLDDIKAVKDPISILAAELDNGTPPDLLKQFKKVLSTKHVKNFIKIFPKVMHGWTVRYNDTDGTAVKAANEAHQDLLKWFTEYVKQR